MWSTTYLCFILLFGGISSIPVKNFIQRKFTYESKNKVYNDAAKDHVAQWDLNAIIYYHIFPEYSIIKMDDISVSTFNGNVKDYKVETTKLPSEAEILTEPFIFHHNMTISVGENEPNWSLNMKRSIASILYIDAENIDINQRKQIIPEKNMFGDCKAIYVLGDDNSGLVIHKNIDIDECGGEIQSYWSANKIVDCNGLEHEQFYREVTREYKFSLDENSLKNKDIESIKADSSIYFHVSPKDPHKIIYQQTQVFTRVKSDEILGGATESLKSWDVSKMFLNKDLKFEHGGKPMDGRKVEETTHVLSKSFYDSLLELKNEITQPVSTNSWDIEKSVLEIWESMDKQTFSSYSQVMDKIKDDKIINDVVLYMLPYVGNNNTLKYMQKLIVSDKIDEYHMFRMISLFPNYVNVYDEELVENMKVLLNLPTDNKLVRNSGILGYSRIVHKAFEDEVISEDIIKKIRNEYLNTFKTSKDYERRMVHLVGLYNLGVDLDILLSIIQDDNESPHLRLIAIKSAVGKLKENTDKVTSIFIPMLKNEDLDFELRVAALNVLLTTKISEKDFDIVYKYLKDEQGDLYHKHLYNYFYSTLTSYVDDTKCTTSMSEFSKKYLPKLEPPHSSDAFMTGNYRLSFSNTGPDYGSTTQVKMIGDPITKTLDYIQLTFDSFKLGLQSKQTYHVKIHGVMDKIIEEVIKTNVIDKKYVQQFIKIKNENYQSLPKQKKIHIELIVYENDKAVFAAHYDENIIKNSRGIKKLLLELTDVMFGDHAYITFPVMDYLHLPSDTGTDLTLGLEEEIIGYDDSQHIERIIDLENTNYKLKHRSLKSIAKSMDVYNPISYVKLGAAASVINNMYSEFKFNFKIDDERFLNVDFNNNDFIYDSQFEVIKSTYVDNEEILHKHCKDCSDSVLAVKDEDDETYEKYFNTTIMGFDLKSTIKGSEPYMDEKFLKVLEKSFTSTIGNFEVFPLAYFWYVYQNFVYHQYYIPNWKTLTDRTQIVPNKDNPLKTEIKINANYEDETSDYEMIPGSSGGISISSTMKTIKEDKVLENMNMSFSFYESPGLYNQSYRIDLDYKDDEDYQKMCFDFDINYPKLDKDYYSIKPAKPTTSKFTIMYDTDSEPIRNCDENSLLTFELNGLFSVMKEQEELLNNEKNSSLTKCIEDSKGFKYTPPTEACQKASKEMSTYRKYDFQGIVSMNTKIRKMFEDNEVNEVDSMFSLLDTSDGKISGNMNFTLELLDSKFKGYYTDDDGSSEEFGDEYLQILAPSHRKTYVEDEFLVTSKDFLDDMEDFEYGLTSACHVTNNFITTFTEEKITRNVKDGDSILGMIDCETGMNGFAYSRIKNKLKMTAWTQGYKIVVEPHGNTLKVTVNDELIDNKNLFKIDELQIYFVADDVLFIKSDPMHLYYNTEYIRAEAYSSYVNKFCGECAVKSKIIKV